MQQPARLKIMVITGTTKPLAAISTGGCRKGKGEQATRRNGSRDSRRATE
jgi:hypothetical protein